MDYIFELFSKWQQHLIFKVTSATLFKIMESIGYCDMLALTSTALTTPSRLIQLPNLREEDRCFNKLMHVKKAAAEL